MRTARALTNGTELAEACGAAEDFIRQAKAPNTIRGFRVEWDQFTAWCSVHERESLPATPETLTVYLSHRAATHKASSLNRTVSAISQAHQMAGFESPTRTSVIRTLLSGIRRAKGVAPTVKTPALTGDIGSMVAVVPDNMLGVRDRAMLLVGFAGAFRRSELVGLNVEDCDFSKDGLTVTLHRSKIGQNGDGRKIGVPHGSNPYTCPVRALQAWLEASGIAAGSLFRYVNRHGKMQPGRLSGGAVALIVKRYAAAAGLDPARYAGHSLRAGRATSAAIRGASERSIMNLTGHRSVQMVRRYIRDSSLFPENAAAKTGL